MSILGLSYSKRSLQSSESVQNQSGVTIIIPALELTNLLSYCDNAAGFEAKEIYLREFGDGDSLPRHCSEFDLLYL
jgi:hypothetical protein